MRGENSCSFLRFFTHLIENENHLECQIDVGNSLKASCFWKCFYNKSLFLGFFDLKFYFFERIQLELKLLLTI